MKAIAIIMLEDLKAKAKQRPPGYLEAVLARGTVQGNKLLIDVDAVKELAERFHPMGLGSYVAKFAKPIAKAIDSTLGTDLEHCKECKAREAWLNKHFPLDG